jgi:vibriolysin
MKKTAFVVGVWMMTSSSLAFYAQHYLNDNADQALRGFKIMPTSVLAKRGALNPKFPENALLIKRVQAYSADTQQYNTSYYQYYQGVRVLDGEITLHESKKSSPENRGASQKKVSGQLVNNIEMSASELERLKTPENIDAALASAKVYFLRKRSGIQWDFSHDHSEVIIKKQGGKLVSLYEVSFYATAQDEMPVHFNAFLDPKQNNKMINTWNGIENFSDSGPGGNDKTKEYHYGVNGIPPLDVDQKSSRCEMADKINHFRVVDMSKQNPSLANYYDYTKPFLYRCKSESRDIDHFYGAYSPADDAYFFGHLVQRAYQEWFQTKVLDLPEVVLRVHFRYSKDKPMDNAFWDSVSATMNFGDGTPSASSGMTIEDNFADGSERGRLGFYPFVSLEITGHEMSHGFTSSHSDLQYHDESGALNEAFSDMAGMMALAYMRENVPVLYEAIYHTPDMVWSIGSTIVRSSNPNAALRYIDRPARDGVSAECYQLVPNCLISYQDVVLYATNEVDEDNRQSFIVHHGSGVYNRFFYNLANTPGWDIKKAFNLMLKSNRDGYWGENSDFQQAACQTLLAASDLAYDTAAVRKAFRSVGIDTQSCQ